MAVLQPLTSTRALPTLGSFGPSYLHIGLSKPSIGPGGGQPLPPPPRFQLTAPELWERSAGGCPGRRGRRWAALRALGATTARAPRVSPRPAPASASVHAVGARFADAGGNSLALELQLGGGGRVCVHLVLGPLWKVNIQNQEQEVRAESIGLRAKARSQAYCYLGNFRQLT